MKKVIASLLVVLIISLGYCSSTPEEKAPEPAASEPAKTEPAKDAKTPAKTPAKAPAKK
ncbi:MAG: hypothetical protein KBF99_16600 [Leptospiraceae bacterium]|nr:hypothetical protein [Leptospiraceae bacterium]MBK7055474.1 hypothetical protein [Leptospiraceae bacterium]MBK9502390.1 hypothetical protein [Leptospiraceae bacterium]MBL0263114.1 hypothetical protein [Leptospiraceae bacterium]MBP6740875.1 hypothetical protein [Leptospiraceae bacterium]